MWLEPNNARDKVQPWLREGKNGFLVAKRPNDHPTHQEQLRGRMPVAKELAKATDAAAEAAGLSDFELARAAKVARDQGLDPRHALAASLNDDMVEALKKFRDRVVDVAKALNAGGCMRSTTSKSRPSKRPRRDAPSRSSSPPPRAAPTAGGLSKKAHKPGRAEQLNMTTWGTNASMPVQLAHLRLQDDEEEG